MEGPIFLLILFLAVSIRIAGCVMVAYEARFRAIGPSGGFILALFTTPLIAYVVTQLTSFKPWPRKCGTCDCKMVHGPYCSVCNKDVFGHEETYYSSVQYEELGVRSSNRKLKADNRNFYFFILLGGVITFVAICRIITIH